MVYYTLLNNIIYVDEDDEKPFKPTSTKVKKKVEKQVKKVEISPADFFQSQKRGPRSSKRKASNETNDTPKKRRPVKTPEKVCKHQLVLRYVESYIMFRNKSPL